MLCATPVLKPGPLRIGRIGNHVTLPRTVPVANLFAAAAGAVAALAVVLLLTSSLMSVVLGAAAGAAFGWVAVSYSPLRGESLTRWLGLQVTSRMNRIEVDGRPARAYVGICPLPEVARGMVRILPGAVDVIEGSVDERGRFVEHAGTIELPDLPRPVRQQAPLPHIPDGAISGTADPHWAKSRPSTAVAANGHHATPQPPPAVAHTDASITSGTFGPAPVQPQPLEAPPEAPARRPLPPIRPPAGQQPSGSGAGPTLHGYQPDPPR
jgi:hypothetical protein